MNRVFLFVIGILFTTSCQNSEELKSEQYFVEGYQLYKNYCSNCHQENGLGMANLYPPLAGTAILKNKAMLACIIQNGMTDTIIVDGKKFNRPMPPNPKLSDLEIAEIISFVTMKWGKDSIYTNIEFVNNSLKDCK